MAQQMGRQSLQFENPPWIISSGCIAGTKEGEGPIGHEIDLIGEDDNFGIFNMVSLCILSGIVDGLGDDLHATHL